MAKNSYTVGYGKPPARTRFKKGHSGNPSGRPKGTPNFLTALERTLAERVNVTENGAKRTISKLEAMIKQMVHKAVAGDARAISMLLPLLPALFGESETAHLLAGEADRAVVASLIARLRRKKADAPPSPGESHE